MATNSLTFELVTLAIEMNQKIQHIKDFYPELHKYNYIKKLVSISDKWDKIFAQVYSSSSREGGSKHG